VSLRRADPTVSAARWAMFRLALVSRDIRVFRPNVGLSVHPTRSALHRRPASTLSVKILVRELAAETLNVASSITIRSASVLPDGLEIQLPVVT
jgi:hypothetical protein